MKSHVNHWDRDRVELARAWEAAKVLMAHPVDTAAFDVTALRFRSGTQRRKG